MMAAIGIEKGKPLKPDARMKKILTDAAAIGNATARAISFFPREPGNLIYGENSAWMMAYANKDTAFEKNGAYNLDARALFHFGYICVSPAMAVTVAGTVRSYWQVYNSDLSAFFRETNYSPEAWVKVHSGRVFWGVKNVANRFGFVHQSNGRDEPISRSWNRIFAKFQFEKGNLVFWIKPWIRVPEEDSKDNNSDITDYYGHGEIQAIYKWHRNVFSVMSRNNLESGFKKGAVEATWSFPLWHYKYLKGYVQGFTGYSHSLIDYDSNETTIGIGVAVTDYL